MTCSYGRDGTSACRRGGTTGCSMIHPVFGVAPYAWAGAGLVWPSNGMSYRCCLSLRRGRGRGRAMAGTRGRGGHGGGASSLMASSVTLAGGWWAVSCRQVGQRWRPARCRLSWLSRWKALTDSVTRLQALRRLLSTITMRLALISFRRVAWSMRPLIWTFTNPGGGGGGREPAAGDRVSWR